MSASRVRPQSRGTRQHVMTCPTSGKRGWTSRADAKRVRKTTGGEFHKYEYQCADCGYWHLGSSLGLSRSWHRSIHGANR